MNDHAPRWYNPAPFRLDDEGLLGDFVDATVFGILITGSEAGPVASHLPFLLDRAAGAHGTLYAHLGRANPHWRSLDRQPALVVFAGPQHYVSPSWYASKARTGEVVPTWNYAAVHVRGPVSVHHDRARLSALVHKLTDRMESGREPRWRVDDAPAAFVSRMIDGIVGVDIPIERIEGKLKLGQNRPAEDRATLAAGLERELPEVWAALTRLPGAPREDSG